MRRACITEGVDAPFTPPTPQTPGVRLTHFLIDPTARTRTIASLPTPQPFPLRLSSSAALSLCLPLCLPLIRLALTRVQNMCIMWMDLVQISPFSNGLLARQRFKVTHADYGMAHDSRYHISESEIHAHQLHVFCEEQIRPQVSDFLFCVPAVD